MASHNEPITYHVYIYDSTVPTGTDVSAYIQPDYASARMLAESRLFQFEAGDLTLNFVDKNTTQTHRYWSNRIAGSASYSYGGKTFDWPMVKVYDPAATATPLYVGFIDKRFIAWDGDVISSFRAVSFLAYMDTLDMRPARNGQGATATYSGLADALARTALLKAGNAAPGGTADVDIKDMDLGAGQENCHWNHSAREWTNNFEVDPATGPQLGDFVPSGSTSITGHRGFVVWKGKVYRVVVGARSEVTLTDMALERTSTPTGPITTAYRMFPIRMYGSGAERNCVCIVLATPRNSYTTVKSNWAGYKWLDPTIRVGTLPLNFIPGWGWAACIGANLALSGVEALTERSSRQSNQDQFWAVDGISILSIDADGGLGDTVSVELSRSYFYSLDKWTPADSVATSSTCSDPGAAPGELWFAEWKSGVGQYQFWRTTWQRNGTPRSANLVGSPKPEYGPPVGGIAVQDRVAIVGTQHGCAVYTQALNQQWKQEFLTVDRPPGRMLAALRFEDVGGDARWIGVPYGNGSGQYVYQKYISGGARYATPSAIPAASMKDLAGETRGNIADEIRVLSCSPSVFLRTYTQGEFESCGIVYATLDADDRERVYASTAYADDFGGNKLRVIQADDDSADCAYPLDGGMSGDWLPPHPFTDSGEGIRRMLTFCRRISTNYTVWDTYVSSRWAVARVHWNFATEPLTIRQVLEQIAISSYSYLKVYNPDAPTSAVYCKVMSRHSYTPPLAGTLSAAEVYRNPQVQGIEWYDGVDSVVNGERITAGTTKIGSQVFRLNGLFLAANWAVGIADRIVANYPSKSAANPTFPYGRRVFRIELRRVNSSGTLNKPGYYHLYQRVTMTCFSNATVSGLILSLGYSRVTGRYEMLLLEWDSHDVDWTTNAPTPTFTDYDAVSVDAVVEPIPSGAPVISVGWLIHPDIVGARANPNPVYPCAYAHKIHLPRGLNLTHYRYGLTEPGGGTHAALWFSVWTDSGGRASYPLEPIPQTFALAIHDGRSTGYYEQELNYYLASDTSGGYPSTSGTSTGWPVTITNYHLAPGVYWVVTIQDGSAAAVTPAPIDWWNGGKAGMGDAWWLGYAAGTSDDYILGAWLDNWDTAIAVRAQYVPAIYLVGEV